MKRPVAPRIAAVAAVLLIVTTACQLFSSTPTPAATPPAVTLPASTVPVQTVQPATPPVSPTAPAGEYSAANCALDGTLNPSQSGLGDSYFPSMGNGGYDVLSYRLELNVDMAAKTLQAHETISAQAQQELKAFNLEFGGLQIDNLLVNGQNAQYQRKGNEMTLTPASLLPADEPFTISLDYHGSPKAVQQMNDNITLGWIWYEGGVYVASEPVGSFTWYAVNDHPCDKALYTYVLTVPKPYVVAANGLLESRSEQGSQVTYTWATQNPLTSYLSTINIARFTEETQQGPNGLPIRNFYDAGLPAGVNKGFNRTPEIVDFYNQTFGTYPFEAYGVAVINSDVGFALETQTLTMFGGRMLGSEINTEMVAAHELAHQWFGDSISLTTWKDIWLNESFASYSQWLWLEKSLGRSAMDSQARQWYSHFRGDPTKPGDPGVNDLFGAAVYYRGALALHALRLNVGDEVFFKILKTYYERYQYQHVTTADFLAVANEVSGEDLSDFFQAWLYEETIPDIPQMNLHDS